MPRSLFALALALTVAAGALADGQICTTGPVAADDSGTSLGKQLVVDVLANDRSDSGELLEVALLGGSCTGPRSVDLFGLVHYQPPNADASCTIVYQVKDESLRTATATIHVTVDISLFADGFESGSLSAWLSCEPFCSSQGYGEEGEQ